MMHLKYPNVPGMSLNVVHRIFLPFVKSYPPSLHIMNHRNYCIKRKQLLIHKKTMIAYSSFIHTAVLKFPHTKQALLVTPAFNSVTMEKVAYKRCLATCCKFNFL